jgi:diguanylate cyclase (GGDEF)-like protein/PAS domain S-box-containing protein
MRLKLKIWLLLAALLSVVLAVDLTVSYKKLRAETRSELEYDAKSIYGFMMATRRIYQQQFVASGLEVNDNTIGFLPAHSFLRISRDFANWNKNGIIFNNVSDRPRNPANRADRFETEAIRWFAINADAKELMREIVTDDGVGYLLFTAPIRVEAYCLRCHGEQQSAPVGIRERYDEAYGYHVGDMRGVVSIRLPTKLFDERVMRIWTSQLIKNLIGYAIIFIALGYILDRLVMQRLARLQASAQRIADGDYDARIDLTPATGRADEIIDLADTFNSMAIEVQNRDRTLGKLSQAVEQSPVNIVITDLVGRIEYVNRACIRDSGYSQDELIGANPRLLASGNTPQDTYRALWKALRRGDTWEGEFHNRRKNGEEYLEWAIIAPVRDKQGTVTNYLAVKQDITEKKRAEAEIHNLAFYDPLTNLPNRRLLMDRLGQALLFSKRTQAHGALLIIDLDNFKYLNDTRGHDIGDRLLKQVAARLIANVRGEDTVARLGGDEFVIILEDLSEDEASAALQAETIAEKARQALSSPYELNISGYSHEATSSLGITLFQGIELGPDILLKQADMALYQAKDAGRDRLRFFYQAMQAAIDARATLEGALRHAIDNTELRVHYQPQVDEHGQVVGAEALLRWLHPTQGSISPAYFIPLAEETGLIHALGEWVLRQACEQLRTWAGNPSYAHMQLAVNVSSHQLRHAGFVDLVIRHITETGIDATHLKLELTESSILENVDETVARMQQLKGMGVKFSLDDFGTGYSSLSYLKRLPLDQVKIYQSFVRGLGREQNDDAIIRAILAISESLGMEAIAEGVEKPEQHAYLRGCGCRYFQGYLFGKPMAIDDWPVNWDSRATSA